MKKLLALGRIVRPSMGVVAVSVTPQLAFSNDLKLESGALVVRVDKDGPAETVGIKPDDVIIAFGGGMVGDLHQVPGQIWAIFHRPGRHPFEVHFLDGAFPTLRGAVEIRYDPFGQPDHFPCGGITVMGGCIEQ